MSTPCRVAKPARCSSSPWPTARNRHRSPLIAALPGPDCSPGPGGKQVPGGHLVRQVGHLTSPQDPGDRDRYRIRGHIVRAGLGLGDGVYWLVRLWRPIHLAGHVYRDAGCDQQGDGIQSHQVRGSRVPNVGVRGAPVSNNKGISLTGGLSSSAAVGCHDMPLLTSRKVQPKFGEVGKTIGVWAEGGDAPAGRQRCWDNLVDGARSSCR